MKTNLNKTIRSKKKGFTLVELLVVISIIGILAIIALASFSSAQKKARDARRKTELNAASKALMMFYTDYGIFPSNTVFQFNTDIVSDRGFTSPTGYVYMKVTPKDPRSDEWPDLYYEVDTNGKSFNLYADLENSSDPECRATESGFTRDGEEYCYAISSPNVEVGTTL